MKRLLSLGLAALMGSVAWASSASQDATETLHNSAKVLTEISQAPDKGIPEEVIARSKCIIVIPHLVKAGVVVGGKHGTGVVVCRTSAESRNSSRTTKGAPEGWSAPAFLTMTGGSLGAQIGAEGVDLVMLVMNDKGLQQLLSNKIEYSLEGSVAAGPVGRHASVGSDSKLDTELLTYSRSKGAFVGQAVEGARMDPDKDFIKAIYGSDVDFKNILMGQVPVPAPAASFLQVVANLSHNAAAQEAKQEEPKK